MLLEAVYHRPKQNWAYAYDGQTLHIRIRTKRDDIDHIEAIVGDKYGWNQTKTTVPMRVLSSDALFDYWETAVIPPFRRLRYAFRLTSGSDSIILTERGFVQEEPPSSDTFFDFPFINPADVFAPPAWVKDAVFYQIFPERFANGDPSLDPEGALPWGSADPTPTNFFGGDLQGVLDHLDHIAGLGVNAVYFTPLFEATTNHKYDTQDYMKVDPHFGTNEKLKELVDECHKRGIRVLLDAVFNHSGKTFPPFVDVMQKGKESKYADWFYVREWPLHVKDGIPTYETFAFEPLMPKLNTEHPEVRQYLFDVATYWIKEIGIDGWRLDVANEVDHQFWRDFRRTVKAVSPEAYILGEIWHDSIAWLNGDQFDAVMNYPFTNAVLDFFGHQKIDAAGFAAAIGSQLAAFPQQVTETAFNLLDSHDTPRLLTICGDNAEALKLAALFQLTYPGTPCIYYGDEVGLNGGGDPGCRKCMVWEPEKQNLDLLEFYSQTVQLRHRHGALRSTDLRFVHIGQADGTIVYERRDGSERLLIAMNARAGAADLSFVVDEAAADPGRASHRLAFTPTSKQSSKGTAAPASLSATAVPIAAKSQASIVADKPAASASSWSTLLASGSVTAETGLTADSKGIIKLSLPAYGYHILKETIQ